MHGDDAAALWAEIEGDMAGGQRLTLADAFSSEFILEGDLQNGIGEGTVPVELGAPDPIPMSAPGDGRTADGSSDVGGLNGIPFGETGALDHTAVPVFDDFSAPGFEIASVMADPYVSIGDAPLEAKGGNKDTSPGGGKGGGHGGGHGGGGGGTTTDPGTTDPGVRSPYEGYVTSTYGLSGDINIDNLTYGTKWGNGGHGSGVTINFSFGTANSVYAVGYHEPTNGFREFSAHQKQATYSALEYWSNVADITFNEVVDSDTVAGDLRFARSSDPSTSWAYLPSGATQGGDVWIGNSTWYDNMSEGTYGFVTLVHEIGHALGLVHPHESTGIAQIAPSSIDWVGYTVMSYYGAEGSYGYNNSFYPTAPMLNDISAIQYIYGANTSHNATDTVYSWNTGANIYESLWDAGGIDTIDWSNQSSAALINLNDGAWSELGPAHYAGNGYDSRTLTIARGAVIENATGGAGNDTIIGNEVGNRIEGGDGADSITGGAGSDTFVYADAADAGDTIVDFSAGAGGDAIDIAGVLASFGYAGTDAFADGYVRTVQSGSSMLVQIDGNGGGDGFTTLVTLENTNEADMSADNWIV